MTEMNGQSEQMKMAIPDGKISGDQRRIALQKEYGGIIIDESEAEKYVPEFVGWMRQLPNRARLDESTKRRVLYVKYDSFDGDGKTMITAKIFTMKYAYSLRVRYHKYLGATVNSRIWRAGEQHHRGADLHDGPYSEATFNNILRGIVGHEMKNLDLDFDY